MFQNLRQNLPIIEIDMPEFATDIFVIVSEDSALYPNYLLPWEQFDFLESNSIIFGRIRNHLKPSVSPEIATFH